MKGKHHKRLSKKKQGPFTLVIYEKLMGRLDDFSQWESFNVGSDVSKMSKEGQDELKDAYINYTNTLFSEHAYLPTNTLNNIKSRNVFNVIVNDVLCPAYQHREYKDANRNKFCGIASDTNSDDFISCTLRTISHGASNGSTGMGNHENAFRTLVRNCVPKYNALLEQLAFVVDGVRELRESVLYQHQSILDEVHDLRESILYGHQGISDEVHDLRKPIFKGYKGVLDEVRKLREPILDGHQDINTITKQGVTDISTMISDLGNVVELHVNPL
jgi:hypothetical protein